MTGCPRPPTPGRGQEMISDTDGNMLMHGAAAISSNQPAAPSSDEFVRPSRLRASCGRLRAPTNGSRPSGGPQNRAYASCRRSCGDRRAVRCAHGSFPLFKCIAPSSATCCAEPRPRWSSSIQHDSLTLQSRLQGKTAPNYSDNALDAAERSVGPKRRRTFDTIVGEPFPLACWP